MIKYKLKDHQQIGVNFIINNPYCLLGDAMGLGKTLQAIEVIKRTKLKTLVVCPSMLKETWANEIRKFSNLRCTILNKAADVDGYEVSIVSYSMLHKFRKALDSYDFIIADEVHYLKNLRAKRTIVFHSLLLDGTRKRFLGLSGTPIKNRVDEFYSPLKLCSYGGTYKFDWDFWDFCTHFSYLKKFSLPNGVTIKKFEGHKNVEELKALLKPIYLRRRASQVLDLPPIVRKDIIVREGMVDVALKEAWDNGEASNFSAAKSHSAFLKTEYTIQYAKDLLDQKEGPLIIFSDHVLAVENIHTNLSKKYVSRKITGSTPMPERNSIIKDFQEGKIDVIAATIGAMSVGVTLTASRNLIFNDLSWVPADILQAEKRIHRIGQDELCTIHRVFCGKIDMMIGAELDKKLVTLAEVM
jgi:SWI/SNF-related matrix-associated actin-dependent regulator 1 of chromatin subfamily A